MNITKDIVTDLLPAYLSKECSEDTKRLIEDYLRNNPEFSKEIFRMTDVSVAGKAPVLLDQKDEMIAFQKTQRLIRRRTFFIAFAVFFSLLPFSFFHTDKTTYWLFLEAPYSAVGYWVAGLIFWVLFFITKRKSEGL